MGQLAKPTHTNPFELAMGFLKNKTTYRSRQVVANSFDGCRTVTITGATSAIADGFEIGELRFFPYLITKPNYLPPIGTTLNKNTYPGLFARIGYTYGGSGINFNLPDIRNRILQVVANAIDIGVLFGSETFDLIHKHNVGVEIENHLFTPAGVVEFSIDETITGGDVTISGTTSTHNYSETLDVAVTISDTEITISKPFVGETDSAPLSISGSDISNHNDTISEAVPHGHTVNLTPPITVGMGTEITEDVADDGLYNTSGYTVSIDLSATGGLAHSFVGGIKDLSHDHNVGGTFEYSGTHSHAGEGSVDIAISHSHSFSGTASTTASHGHDISGRAFNGQEEDLVHSITVTEGEDSIPISIMQPSINIYCLIKIA